MIDPEIAYTAASFGGIVSGDQEVLYEGVWQAYNNVQVRVYLNSLHAFKMSSPVVQGILLLHMIGYTLAGGKSAIFERPVEMNPASQQAERSNFRVS